jgi:hypothetical protein
MLFPAAIPLYLMRKIKLFPRGFLPIEAVILSGKFLAIQRVKTDLDRVQPRLSSKPRQYVYRDFPNLDKNNWFENHRGNLRVNLFKILDIFLYLSFCF